MGLRQGSWRGYGEQLSRRNRPRRHLREREGRGYIGALFTPGKAPDEGSCPKREGTQIGGVWGRALGDPPCIELARVSSNQDERSPEVLRSLDDLYGKSSGACIARCRSGLVSAIHPRGDPRWLDRRWVDHRAAPSGPSRARRPLDLRISSADVSGLGAPGSQPRTSGGWSEGCGWSGGLIAASSCL